MVLGGNRLGIILSKFLIKLIKLFQKIDLNHDNLVSFEELKQGFEKVNFSITDEEIRTIISEKGKTEANFLSQKEFSQNFYSLLKVLRCKEAINNLALI